MCKFGLMGYHTSRLWVDGEKKESPTYQNEMKFNSIPI